MEDQQALLREAWTGGHKGCMSALAEARAWALREVWRKEKKSEYGMLAFIAQRVKKVGGGSPSRSALFQFFERIASGLVGCTRAGGWLLHGQD